ncbi:tubulin-specific chaperone E-like [Asterias rubens]|uniref:tubulin-specific chaperone E-like n=1 Tax=Asterias rubens TaxID=7604 RepID=UPI0014555C62|nr:tubulin-specific chaperone E-like [Asterias rubens]
MSPSKEDSHEQDIAIGARFVSEGDLGTVRYVGDVPPTKGKWLGVEWDNPGRGKHDGSRDGVQYFQCSSPTGGSFIRPKKADFGTDFYSALQERYVPDNKDTADINDEDMFICGNNNQVTIVEMVGAASVAKQQSSFSSIKDVFVRDMRINCVGSSQLEQTLPKITELDLSKNLIPTWEVVAELCSQLKQLKRLSLSENRLQIPATPSSFKSSFANLQDLFLNYLNITWPMVADCAPMWPQLKNLHLCFNQISKIDQLRPDTFEILELLNVEGNQISEWDDIMHFSSLPRLNTLILNSNSLACVKFDDTSPTATTQHFCSLRSLSISGNAINSWRDISDLEKLASLTELRIRRNPFLNGISPESIRELLVAKIGSLKICNGSTINSSERKGSEIDYVIKTCKEWLASGGSREEGKSNPSQEFLGLHPRYPKLLEVYGIPEESELVVKSSALKETLIQVTIKCPDAPSKKVLTKKLPGTMEIQRIKNLIHRLLKVEVTAQNLTYTSLKIPGKEIELDNDMRQLMHYSLENGDTILVRW